MYSQSQAFSIPQNQKCVAAHLGKDYTDFDLTRNVPELKTFKSLERCCKSGNVSLCLLLYLYTCAGKCEAVSQQMVPQNTSNCCSIQPSGRRNSCRIKKEPPHREPCEVTRIQHFFIKIWQEGEVISYQKCNMLRDSTEFPDCDQLHYMKFGKCLCRLIFFCIPGST